MLVDYRNFVKKCQNCKQYNWYTESRATGVGYDFRISHRIVGYTVPGLHIQWTTATTRVFNSVGDRFVKQFWDVCCTVLGNESLKVLSRKSTSILNKSLVRENH